MTFQRSVPSGFLGPVLSTISEPIANGFSRVIEHNADVYGQEAVHGIVADPAVHEAVIARVTEAAAACGLARVAMAPSPITGATGNQEFFLHLRAAG